MNRQLPKSIQDALAREATSQAHLSPDVLTAFVENALSGGEKERVTDHLARCTECREEVFLASNAAEEPVAEEQKRIAAAAEPRRSPVLTGREHAWRPVADASAAQAPQRKWIPRMIWALPFAAALVLVIGFAVQRFVGAHPAPQLASKTDINTPLPNPTEPQPAPGAQLSVESAASKPSHELQARTPRAKGIPQNSANTAVTRLSASIGGEENRLTADTSEPDRTQDTTSIVIGGTAKTAAPAAPLHNAFAANQAESTTNQRAMGGALSPMPQSLARRKMGLPSTRWRVTAEGHLERYADGGWTRMLATQPTRFRAVAVVGEDVWAGGDVGALLHSSDGGQHWSTVALSDSNVTVTAAIVTIEFDDPQRGLVSTEDGLHFRTDDGGKTWTRE